MANDLSTRPDYPGYLAGDKVNVHRPGAPNVDYKATPAQVKPFLDAAGLAHSALSGLADDHHTQYLTQARGDARYYTETEVDSTISVIDGRITALEAAPGGGGEWGTITGTIGDQADLVSALAGKRSTSVLVPAAEVETTSTARFTTDADITKLAGIEASAQVNQGVADIASALDTYLGSTAWRTGAGGGDQVVAILYNSVNSSTIPDGSSGNVNFDTAAYLKSGVSITMSGGEITINDTGKFLISAKATHNTTDLNTKSLVNYVLQTDLSGSWANITGAKDVASEAGTSSGSTTLQNDDAFIIGYVNLTSSGKKIKVVASPVASNGDTVMIAECCQMVIQKLEVVSAGGGDGTPITFYDESTDLGEPTEVKFTGAGVTASIEGGTGALLVNVPAQTAAAAGDSGTVQFNNSGTQAGAAGVKVKSPTNGPGKVNHILHADTYTGGCFYATVAAGASWWSDSYHSVAYNLTLQGNVTLKGAAIKVENNSEIASSKVYLVNSTASTITVTVDTADGQFDEVLGLSNPFTIDANTTKIVYMTARKDSSGVLTRALEG